jgi:hypothetical protein
MNIFFADKEIFKKELENKDIKQLFRVNYFAVFLFRLIQNNIHFDKEKL